MASGSLFSRLSQSKLFVNVGLTVVTTGLVGLHLGCLLPPDVEELPPAQDLIWCECQCYVCIAENLVEGQACPERVPTQPTCVTTADCSPLPDYFVCVDHVCVNPGRCSSDDECSPGQTCQGSVCNNPIDFVLAQPTHVKVCSLPTYSQEACQTLCASKAEKPQDTCTAIGEPEPILEDRCPGADYTNYYLAEYDPSKMVVPLDSTQSSVAVSVEGAGEGRSPLVGNVSFFGGICPGHACDIGINVDLLTVPTFSIGNDITARDFEIFSPATAWGSVDPAGNFTIQYAYLRLAGWGKLEIDSAPDQEGSFEVRNKQTFTGHIDAAAGVFSAAGIIEDDADGRTVTMAVSLVGTFAGLLPPAAFIDSSLRGFSLVQECAGPNGVPFAASGAVYDLDGQVVFKEWILNQRRMSLGDTVTGFFSMGFNFLLLQGIDNDGLVGATARWVRVEDTTGPEPAANPLPTLVTAVGCPPIAAVPTATDRCTGETTPGTTTDPLVFTEPGSAQVSWLFLDTHGNTTAAIQPVEVQEPSPPVPAVQELPTLTGECAVVVTAVPTATDACGQTIIATTDSPLPFEEQGTYEIIWKYADAFDNVTVQTQVVVVQDVTPPALSNFAYSGPLCLWAPNHKYVVLRVGRDFAGVVTDNCDPSPTLVVTTAVSDQPDNGVGDGSTTSDTVVFNDRVCLRSERQGADPDGRLYSVTIAARDFAANESEPTVQIRVSHDQALHDCPALDPGEFVDQEDQVCQLPPAGSIALASQDSSTSCSAMGDRNGIWASVLLLIPFRRRRRIRTALLAIATSVFLACSPAGTAPSGSYTVNNGGRAPVALPADFEADTFGMPDEQTLLLCGGNRNTGRSEIRAYHVGLQMAPFASFGRDGVVAADPNDPILQWFGQCVNFATPPGPYVALWMYHGGVLFDPTGRASAEFTGGVGDAVNGAVGIITATVDAAMTSTVTEMRIDQGALSQVRSTTLPVAAAAIAGGVDNMLFVGTTISGPAQAAVGAVIAYDSDGAEKFRIWDSQPFGDSRYAHCSVTDVWLDGERLYTLDASCRRLREYDRRTGAFTRAVELDRTAQSIGGSLGRLAVLTRDGDAQWLEWP